MHRLERRPAAGARPAAGGRPTRLDLAEGERTAVVRNDVELAPARAVVAVEDPEATPDEMLGGKPLTKRS